MNQGTAIRLSTAAKVALVGLFRLKEAIDSILMLSLNGKVRDASILMLSLQELELDLRYIAQRESRAAEWIKHSDLGKKPWRVSFLMSEVYECNAEKSAAGDIYRLLCAIKHGNPAAGTSSFPLGVVNNWLCLQRKSALPDEITIVLYASGITGCGILRVAIDAISASGFSIGPTLDLLRAKRSELDEVYSRHLRQIIRHLLSVSHGSVAQAD